MLALYKRAFEGDFCSADVHTLSVKTEAVEALAKGLSTRTLPYAVSARARAPPERGCIGKKGATYAARFRDVMNDWGVSRFWASTDRGVAA